MFRLSDSFIEPGQERLALADARAGALATFEGWVRIKNEGKTVTSLEYEAYEDMAIIEGRRIIDEARERFALIDARATHRTGLLGIGDLAVYVAVTAEHRDAAFAACRYIIDEIKHRLPIWKRETYEDGSHTWVNCSQHSCIS
ncbi:MAG: molybdenum cofactor biosynthesis protein MoaE [Cyanobacteria bacterium HKST-UBA02]|nr:molybdenum cofactor biosynthesis protein MoaE [Cyanobacteria bacterium HKST-UBA02]